MTNEYSGDFALGISTQQPYIIKIFCLLYRDFFFYFRNHFLYRHFLKFVAKVRIISLNLILNYTYGKGT